MKEYQGSNKFWKNGANLPRNITMNGSFTIILKISIENFQIISRSRVV